MMDTRYGLLMGFHRNDKLNTITKKPKIKNMTDFPEFVDDNNTINGGKVLEKVLTSPVRAFQFINTYQYEKHLHVLLFLYGVVKSFDRAVGKNFGDKTSLWGIIGLSVIMGGFFGWISFYVYSFLISWTGKWLNGVARTDAVLRIFAYAALPSVLGLVVLVIQIAIFGKAIFTSDGVDPYASTLSEIVIYGTLFLQIVLSLWSLVLLVIGIAQVQKFSIGYAILNIILPGLLVLAVVALFTIPFMF